MEVNDLQYLINQGEGLRIEFKDARDSVPASFYETVVSFSNTDGGTILLGVDDQGKVNGIDENAEISLMKNIITALNSRDCIDPPVYVQPFCIKHQDGKVMVIQIPASSQVHNHKGIVYSRDFESDLDITKNHQRLSDLYMPLYVPGAHPVFLENDIFKTVIPLRFVNLGTYAHAFINWLSLDEKFSKHLEVGLAEIELSSDFFDFTWEQLLLQLVPSWHQKGTQLNSLKWTENQIFKEEEIKQVPGWNKKGTQLLKKKNWYLIGILSLCTSPIALSDLMAAFNYKNAKTFRDNYLKPLRESGLIVFTIPEKPTNPDNKYVITQQGKAFLGGLIN